jgi:maltose O-acetyltransferase
MRRALARMYGAMFRLWAIRRGDRLQIGPNLELYGRLDIRGPGIVKIGAHCVIGGAWGDRSQFVTLYTQDPESILLIGSHARLFAARVSCKYSIIIGDNVLIEESGILDTDFHSLNEERGPTVDESPERCRVTIGNRVSIASRCLISKGVGIGSDTIVGPGSIVTRSIPDGCFALGNPARVIDRLEALRMPRRGSQIPPTK